MTLIPIYKKVFTGAVMFDEAVPINEKAEMIKAIGITNDLLIVNISGTALEIYLNSDSGLRSKFLLLL
jgi:hypothetical protein